ASLNTTQIYTHITIDRLRAVHDATHPAKPDVPPLPPTPAVLPTPPTGTPPPAVPPEAYSWRQRVRERNWAKRSSGMLQRLECWHVNSLPTAI
ncbi:MAG: hypothetical protein ACK578_01585, partial [Pirellula sp.]